MSSSSGRRRPSVVKVEGPWLRCPFCPARVRPGDAWCSLCQGDLRPAPRSEAKAEPQRRTVAGPIAGNQLPAVLIEGLLAELAIAEPKLTMPESWTRFGLSPGQSRARKFTTSAVALIALLALLLTAMTVAGLLL